MAMHMVYRKTYSMINPFFVLGVAADADDAAIRAAYLAAVRACPPERDAARFECIRSAYESIADARRRRSHALFDTSLPTPSDLLYAVGDVFKPSPPSLQTLSRLLGGV